MVLVAPLVFEAPSGPSAREIATREPKGSEVSISKPARALRTLRRPPHRRRLVADVWLGASSRCLAGPRHRPRAPQPARALRSLRRPPHRWRLVADVWLGASARSPARPRHRPPHQCDLNVARNSPAATSNFEFASLQLQRLWIGSKSDRGKLCATFVWLWPCRRPPASEISRVKPASPLLAQAEPQLKPPSPLRVRNGRFWRGFRLQR